MKQSFIFIAALLFSLNISAQKAEKQDSLNIPVILVDGVEVSNIDNIAKDDIQSVTVIKTPSVTKLFAPLSLKNTSNRLSRNTKKTRKKPLRRKKMVRFI